MSLIFTDGFDGYSSSSTNNLVANKWRYPEKMNGSLTVASISPHNHGQSILLNSSSDSLFLNWGLHENVPTDNMRSGVIGCHFQTSDFTLNSTTPILSLYDSTNASYQLTLRTSTVGVLQIYRGNIQILQAGSTLSVDTWYHLEWKFYIGNSIPGDSCVLRLNGTTDINLVAGTDTQLQVSSACGGVEFEGASSKNRYFDNIYICNHSGSINKDFIGPCFIETINPNGNGTTNNFTGSDGNSTDNYLLVDDVTNDDDTTFVASSTDNHLDLYSYEAPTGDIGIIHGIGMVSRAKKNTTAAGTMANVAHVSGSDISQGSVNLHQNYRYILDIVEINPSTSAKWVEEVGNTQITSNEFGVRYDV